MLKSKSRSVADAAPPQRAMDSVACENAPSPVAIMKRRIASAGRTDWHSHRRIQLLYATSGLMVVAAERAAWMVPTGHGLLVAGGVLHDASCSGPLGLCTAYIEPHVFEADLAAGCRSIQVTPLLDAALCALADEPEDIFEPDGRSGLLAQVILDEIKRAPDTSFALPMPQDLRLRKICDALIADPALQLQIDDWAGEAGLSRRTLTRRFREETSLSFSEWRRIARAARARITRAEGIPLSVAAHSVGYRSVPALRTMMARKAALESKSS
jgi:AraC-like DNA-binding protein/quercetin dioxygenase-like cupin family protein